MKRKKINRSILFLSLCGVFVTIIAMSVVYAALSSKLLIDGSAEIPNSSFGLKVEKADFAEVGGDDFLAVCSQNGYTCGDNYMIKGNAQLINEPTISGTSINDYKVSFHLPGDMIGISYKVTNVGSIPVKLIDIIQNDFEYTSLSNVSSDVQWAIDNVIYDYAIESFSEDSNLNINDIVCPGEEVYFSFMIGIKDTATTISSSVIEISDINIAFDFVQTDQYLCER